MSKIQLERVPERADADWEAFLDGPTDGTLFHRLSFLRYHSEDRFRVHALRATRKDRTIAVIPLAEGTGPHEGRLVSPFGGSFGGFATAQDLGAETAGDLVDALLDYARANDFGGLLLSSRPAPYRIHGDGIEFALASRGARIVATEITQIASLAGSEDDVRARLRGTSRRGARKAERLGTTVRLGTSADAEAFHAMLTADRARLDAVPTHSREELDRLEELCPGAQRLLLAENEGELVGGVLLFRAMPQVDLSFYTCRTDSPRADRCMNLLLEAAMLDGHTRGALWLDYGTSSVGGELNAGLSEFKESHGGVPFTRDAWRLDL